MVQYRKQSENLHPFSNDTCNNGIMAQSSNISPFNVTSSDRYSILLVQALHISGKFWNGDVQFTWDNTSQSYDEFYITRGNTIDRHDWQKSYNNSYLFRSVIRYPSVTITVYEAVKGKRHNFTYKGNQCQPVAILSFKNYDIDLQIQSNVYFFIIFI